jgi:mRNA-degrading endonuclease toxin of MazEF toxin-antitoxin module
LESDSEILVDQILAWDNSLFRRELGMLPDGLREELKTALREFLDL